MPYYLSDDLASDVGNAAVDSDRLLCRLCQHAAKLSLRHASEATKATIVVLAKWTTCQRGLSPQQQYDLFSRFKPVVTKYLTATEESKYLLELPVAWEDLGQEMAERVFPTGKPAQVADLADEICKYVRRMPLRKDNRLLQSSSHVLSSNGQVPAGYLAVEDICKVVDAFKSIQPKVEPTTAGQALDSAASTIPRTGQLAICDRPRVDISEPQEANASTTMSVEEQLALLRMDMEPDIKPGASGGPMKKPSASSITSVTRRPRGRPPGTGNPRVVRKAGLKKPAAAVIKDASTGREPERARSPKGAIGSKGSRDKKGAVKPKGKKNTAEPWLGSKRIRKGKATVTPKGANAAGSDRAARRQAILACVPKKIQLKYRSGCSKCRYTRCTVSCWRSRGFELPL